MREIKFRAWNRAAKRFTYFNVRPSIEFTQDNKVGMFLSTTDRVYLTPYEDPEQYTCFLYGRMAFKTKCRW